MSSDNETYSSGFIVNVIVDTIFLVLKVLTLTVFLPTYTVVLICIKTWVERAKIYKYIGEII